MLPNHIIGNAWLFSAKIVLTKRFLVVVEYFANLIERFGVFEFEIFEQQSRYALKIIDKHLVSSFHVRIGWYEFVLRVTRILFMILIVIDKFFK